MVVVESDLLPIDPVIVMIPLLPDYSAVKQLNPGIEVDGKHMILATRLIAAVRRSSLMRTGNVADQGVSSRALRISNGRRGEDRPDGGRMSAIVSTKGQVTFPALKLIIPTGHCSPRV